MRARLSKRDQVLMLAVVVAGIGAALWVWWSGPAPKPFRLEFVGLTTNRIPDGPLEFRLTGGDQRSIFVSTVNVQVEFFFWLDESSLLEQPEERDPATIG